MRIITFLLVLTSFSVFSQNFQENLFLKEPLRNRKKIKSVETFFYSSDLERKVSKQYDKEKFGFSELLEFENGYLVRSTSRNIGKLDISTYVYNDKNCLTNIINSSDDNVRLIYSNNKVKVLTYNDDKTNDDEYKVFELDDEGDILKRTIFYADGSFDSCEVSYNEKKEIIEDGCDLLVYKMNLQREKDLQLFANTAIDAVNTIEEVLDDSKTIYTYKGKLLQEEIYFVKDKLKYRWTYKYDQNGNWIERRTFFGKHLRGIQIRNITYKHK